MSPSRKLTFSKSECTGGEEMPSTRRIDRVEPDVRVLRIREWKRRKLNRSQWRRISAIVWEEEKKILQ
jgi:hypothetical protein